MYVTYRDKVIAVFLAFVSTLNLVNTEIVVSPKDVEAQVGASATFNCSSSIPGNVIQWNFYPFGKSMQVVYAFSKINSQYVGRLTVQDGHNLHISSVTADDAGKYECHDDFGHGEKHSADLIILESNPICRSNTDLDKVVGKNTCGIEPSQVILSCTVQFHGNKAPTLEWKKTGDNNTIKSGISNEIRGNRVLHNLTMKGDIIVAGSSYYCRPAKAASTSSACNSGKITTDGNYAKNDSCQSYILVILLMIILTIPLFNVITAAVVWYLFIQKPNKKCSEEGEKKRLLEKEEPEKSDNGAAGHSNIEGPPCTLPCQCSRNGIIFVLLMAIPFCIGLPLFYILVYRRVQPKNQKDNPKHTRLSSTEQETTETDVKVEIPEGVESNSQESTGCHIIAWLIQLFQMDEHERNDDELATFLNRPLKMKEMEKTNEDLKCKRQTLLTENKALQLENGNSQCKIKTKEEENENLQSENESLKKRNDNLLSVIYCLKENYEKLQKEKKSLTKPSENLDTKKKASERNETEETIKQLEAEYEILFSRLEDHKQTDRVKYAGKPRLIHTIEMSDPLTEGQWISGLAVLGNELFVVHKRSSKIEVYNSVTYQYTRKFQIAIIKEPYDLTVGKVDKCLFVIGSTTQAKGRSKKKENPISVNKEEATDVKNVQSGKTIQMEIGDMDVKNQEIKNNIVIVRLDVEGNLLEPWPKSSEGAFGHLSTYESNLIVCLFGKNVIKEFSRDGDEIRTVRLSPSAGSLSLIHAMKVTRTHYAVCHGYEKNELHGICLVDSNGVTKMEYTGFKSETITPLELPIHFIEDDNRYLLVADRAKSRILMLDWNLKFQRILIQFGDGQFPERLCFDEGEKHLFVSMNRGKDKEGLVKGADIFVYAIK